MVGPKTAAENYWTVHGASEESGKGIRISAGSPNPDPDNGSFNTVKTTKPQFAQSFPSIYFGDTNPFRYKTSK